MPKVIVVTGFKKTGKTSLIEALIGELVRRGHRVGAIKHTVRPYPIDTPGKDTQRQRKAGAQASALLTPEESAIFFHRPLELNEAIRLLGTLDFILLEGFKELDRAPRIIAARNMEEVEQLRNGLEIAVTGEIAENLVRGLEVPIFDSSEVEALANLVEEKAMPLLPGLNCGKCGYPSCKELAKAALAGKAEATRCINLLSAETQVLVDGAPLSINPFVGKVIRNVVMGIVSTLKGVEAPKSIEVRFTIEEDSEGEEEH
jgi:molybdopterin-guanine dinucleotide biosynthesis protein B